MNSRQPPVPVLSRDVFGLILGHFFKDGDYASLSRLSTVSKQFRDIIDNLSHRPLQGRVENNKTPTDFFIGPLLGSGGFCKVFLLGACNHMCIKIATQGNENGYENKDFDAASLDVDWTPAESAITRLVMTISSGEVVAQFLSRESVDLVVKKELNSLQTLAPNGSLLPRVFAAGLLKVSNRQFLILERILGPTLRQVFRTTYPEQQGGNTESLALFSVVDFKILFIRLLKTLLGPNGFKHGDIKPENIMIASNPLCLRLIDPAPSRFGNCYAAVYMSDLGDAPSLAAVVIEAIEGEPLHRMPPTVRELFRYRGVRSVALKRLCHSRHKLVCQIATTFIDNDGSVSLEQLLQLLLESKEPILLNIPAKF